MTPQPFRATACLSRHMTARARVTAARTSLFLRNACLPCSTYCSSTPVCSRQTVRLTTWRDMQAGTFPFLSMGSFCVRGNCPAGAARRKADRARRTGQGHCLTPHSPPPRMPRDSRSKPRHAARTRPAKQRPGGGNGLPGGAGTPACMSHHPTVEAHDTSTRTSLRLLAVLNVLSSTPARAKRLAPRPDGPLTHFASPRGETCRLAPNNIFI